jgi:secreted trypsin-like serine protease
MLDRPLKHSWCVAAVALALLHIAAARAAVTPRIVNGLDTFGFPTTGALLYGAGGAPITADNAMLFCSGTLIGCRTFLTAAHCVSSDGDPTHYAVYLQSAGVIAVSSVTYNPSYTGLGGNDVAVLKLATDVTGIAPTPINSTHDLNALGVGLPGTIVGFGLSYYNARDVGIKRTGAVVTANCVTSVTGGQGNDKLVCWDFAIPVGPPGTDSDTCSGDSGGPLFMDFNGVTEVVGTTVSGSSPTCLPVDHSYDASVYYNAAWIQSQIGTDSTVTCGGIGPIGSPSASVIGNAGALSATHMTDSFSVDVGTPSVLRFALNGQDSRTFNVDLYVKAGLGASPSSYDCKADGLSVFGGCEFLNPTPGIWSIFVSDAAGAGLYQVATTIFAGAPPPTPTPTPTDTPVPATFTATDTPTATLTATPTATNTPALVKTRKPTRTPKPTATPKPTRTPRPRARQQE